MDAATGPEHNRTILGLDIGTSSTKAVLFDLSGTELAVEERAYRHYTSQPGWVEQNPEEVWQALLHVVRAVVDRARDQKPIHALAIAAQSGSLLPARSDGSPVSRIITWMDGRTESLVREWRADGVEARVRAISGWHLYPGLCLPTIAWLRQHQPDAFAAAERYLSVNDFLVHRLTGHFCMNPSNGSGMQLVDVQTGDWSPDLCALAGIEPGQLSPILPSGTAIGPITPEVSRLTGLSPGTVVVNGGHDQGCTALGLGLRLPGEIVLACGTAWVLTGLTDAPDVTALPPALDLNFLPVPEHGLAEKCWTASQSLGGLGASLEWLMQRCWPATDSESHLSPRDSGTRRVAFATMDAELPQTTSGGNGLFFLPLAGGHSAPAGDQRGGFWGLRLDHSRADMARAVMEGAAYELRWALEPIRQASRGGVTPPIERLWMIGGAARSPLWPAIVADVTGLSLTLPQTCPEQGRSGQHWPAVGAAILAGLGIRAFETVETGQAHFQRPCRHIEPDPTTVQIYDGSFADYQQWARLARDDEHKSTIPPTAMGSSIRW